MGVEEAGETPSLTGEFIGETHRVLECTQNHSPRDEHQKGPICLWAEEEVTESWQRAEQEALFPLRPLPHIQSHNTVRWVALSWQIPKAPPLTKCTGVLRQRNMPQMKEQIKTPEKELNNEEIAKLSDAEFKTLVVRRLTEVIELGCKMKGEMKAIQSKIKENIQGTNSEGKETETQINDLEQKEKSIQPKQNEETRIQKNEERLRKLGDNFKRSNI